MWDDCGAQDPTILNGLWTCYVNPPLRDLPPPPPRTYLYQALLTAGAYWVGCVNREGTSLVRIVCIGLFPYDYRKYSKLAMHVQQCCGTTGAILSSYFLIKKTPIPLSMLHCLLFYLIWTWHHRAFHKQLATIVAYLLLKVCRNGILKIYTNDQDVYFTISRWPSDY